MGKREMISKGKDKYESGIDEIGGAKTYYDCGDKGGMDVAVCLKNAKRKLDESDWAEKWETAMSA